MLGNPAKNRTWQECYAPQMAEASMFVPTQCTPVRYVTKVMTVCSYRYLLTSLCIVCYRTNRGNESRPDEILREAKEPKRQPDSAEAREPPQARTVLRKRKARTANPEGPRRAETRVSAPQGQSNCEAESEERMHSSGKQSQGQVRRLERSPNTVALAATTAQSRIKHTC